MHECELHLAQIFSKAWDDAYALIAAREFGELSEAFFEQVYKNANKICSTFDNLDIQFDTIDTCLKWLPASAPVSGIVYSVIVAYQIEEETYGFSVYFGQKSQSGAETHKSKYCDVACIMSAPEEVKDHHMLEYFFQLTPAA